SILEPLRAISAADDDVVLAHPTRNGTFPIDLFEGSGESISAVSAMHTNNETGALNPIRELSALCRERGALLHSDCVQAMGWADLSVDGLGVDLMTVSAHKIYGPKGVGVLFVRAGALELTPFVRGGSQERRRRGGTENVSAIVGMAAALDLAVHERAGRVEHYSALKRRLRRNIESTCPGEFIVNTPQDSAPHILNVSFPPAGDAEVDGEMLLLNLDVARVHTSSGSACTSGAVEPSHVLLAMGVQEATARATIRFSFGVSNTLGDMDVVADELSRILSRMRARVA
ncbi:MAG TPA: aminotransferase class V-fold PLP-dependent enzyme, partial [Rhodothermia bacterium]